MRRLLFILPPLFAFSVTAQQIPSWVTPYDSDPLPYSHAGYGGGVDPPTFPVVVNITNVSFGGVGNGTTDNSIAWTNALAAAVASLSTNVGAAIYFPSGVYKITNCIAIPSNIAIRGDGENKTVFLLSFGTGSQGRGDGCILGGAQDATRTTVGVTAGYTRGSTTLTVASATGLKTNQLCRFYQNDDTNVILGTNIMERGNFHDGQMFIITGISGTTLAIDSPINSTNYQSSFSPTLEAFSDMTTNWGIEGIGFSNTASVASFNLYVYNSYNFWINGVASTNCVVTNMRFEECYHGTIQHCDAWWHQTQASSHDGIVFAEYSCENLCIDNVSEINSTAFMVQIFSSANAFGYCFASIGAVGGNNFANGFTAHGDYPKSELFEGCIGPWCPSYDETWGMNRNCITLRSWAMRDGWSDPQATTHFVQGNPGVYLDSTNRYHVLIGNIVGTTDVGQPAYSFEIGYARGHGNNPPSAPYDTTVGPSCIQFGNLDLASGQYTNVAYTTPGTISNSMIYASIPWWFKGPGTNLAWPPIGPDVSTSAWSLTNTPVIPAMWRRFYGTNLFIDPTITAQPPATTNVTIGNPVTLAATTAGSSQRLYQWTKNGSSIAGATGTSYTIASVGSGDAATYNVLVTDQIGTTKSANSLLNGGGVGSVTSLTISGNVILTGNVTLNK